MPPLHKFNLTIFKVPKTHSIYFMKEIIFCSNLNSWDKSYFEFWGLGWSPGMLGWYICKKNRYFWMPLVNFGENGRQAVAGQKPLEYGHGAPKKGILPKLAAGGSICWAARQVLCLLRRTANRARSRLMVSARVRGLASENICISPLEASWTNLSFMIWTYTVEKSQMHSENICIWTPPARAWAPCGPIYQSNQILLLLGLVIFEST